MQYEAPVVEIVGAASALIQNNFGGNLDGGPIGYNHLPVQVPLERDEK